MGLLFCYSNLAHCGEEISYSLGEHKTIKYVGGTNNYSFQYGKIICTIPGLYAMHFVTGEENLLRQTLSVL